MTDNKPIKEKVKAAFYLLGRGAFFGAIAIFVALASFWFLVLPLSGFWQLDLSEATSFLIAALLGSLLLGLPAGGDRGFNCGKSLETYDSCGYRRYYTSLSIFNFCIFPCALPISGRLLEIRQMN